MENTNKNTEAKAPEKVAKAMTYGATTHTPAPVIKGDMLMLFDSNKKSIAYATSHSLSISCDIETISTKDHGEFGDSVAGKINWEITAEHLFSASAYDELFTYMLNKEPFTVYWGQRADEDGNTPAAGGVANWTPENVVYTGKALVTSLEATADTGSKATFSVTLTGCGDFHKMTFIDPNPA